MSQASDVLSARARLLDAVRTVSGSVSLPLNDALDQVLAEPVIADCDVPPADNSAMDGYALRHADIAANSRTLRIAGRLSAGEARCALPPQTAIRIFTGAVIPEGADTVVMQEDCSSDGETVQFPDDAAEGANIRRAGEDIRRGATVLSSGQRLRPQDLGLAASVGQPTVTVRRPLRVAIVVTGNELIPPGEPLPPGKIYESNSAMLAALLHGFGCQTLTLPAVADTLTDTKAALQRAAVDSDLIVSCGGVSVGEEDHVRSAVESLGQLELWRIAVKPGKPLAFGTVNEIPFLGLPGNPVSAFVTFLLFGTPILRKLQGREHTFPEALAVPAGFSHRAGKREEYLRVRIVEGRAEAYPHQGSGVLSSTAWADGLARIPTGDTVSLGDTVDYYPFSRLLE